ncbi:N-acetylmuramoyl-L-alanine amidase [Clostridium sp. C8-1-8]|uniref:N-acetylmuramoyl-L-alanine amidase n=1 Tax=Clostridium sp. C8-1-8 TaxID=2698831 RepID=UPI00136F3852|nr:N-acetylmuramoyl-L-alanine amidase [Clostridium sp. C8-1-8]
MRKLNKVLSIICVFLFISNLFSATKVYAEQAQESMNVIDDPVENFSTFDGSMLVRGWAISKSGLKEVKVYIDDNLEGYASLGLARPDVGKAYPNYVNSNISGYAFTVDLSKYKEGNHKVSVQAVSADGSIKISSKNIEKKVRKPLANLDSPVGNSHISKESLLVRGWALNPSGLRYVGVYLNNAFKGYATIGEIRTDIDAAYPGYPAGKNSGINYIIENKDLNEGQNVVRIEAVGTDGSKVSDERVFYVYRGEPRIAVDEPSDNATISDDFLVRGWALNASGITKVNVYVDNANVGTATLGQSREDVKRAYPNYPDADKSGYILTLRQSGIGPGIREVKVEAIGSDGTSSTAIRKVNIIKPQPEINIDTVRDGQDLNRGQVNLGGWAVNYSGVRSAKVYLDNNYLGDANIGFSRPDVKAAYPKYYQAESSGFNYTLNMQDKSSGIHNLKVVAIGNDGTVKEKSLNVYNGKRLIVVDPGHNYGKDYGAERTIDKVIYSETELNMQVAVKLQATLTSMGYTVVMTRQPWQRPTDSLDDSLQGRTKLANDLKADLFVSIHHDVSDSNSTTNGVSTHYSSYRPSLDNDGIVSGSDPGGWSYDDLKIDTTPTVQAQLSKQLANNVVNALGSRLGYNNLRAHDHGLYVTRNINTPSILIECGFISNPEEAKRCANQDEQQKKADVIAGEIRKLF